MPFLITPYRLVYAKAYRGDKTKQFLLLVSNKGSFILPHLKNMLYDIFTLVQILGSLLNELFAGKIKLQDSLIGSYDQYKVVTI